MKKYRHRNGDVVDAVQIDDWTFARALPNPDHVEGCKYDGTHRTVKLPIADGGRLGTLGDWIVRYANGSLAILGAVSFRSLYTLINEPAAEVA